MVSSIFFFTGQNTFALREEKRVWKEQFISKHGAENLLTLDGKGLQLRSLLDEVSAAPFIAAKRLCVVEGVPPLSTDEMEVLTNAIHPDCVLLVADASPDKRLAAVKALAKVATIKEFPLLSGAALRRWMQQEADRSGSLLQTGAAEELLALVGEEQETLAQEIAKLSLYAGAGGVTREHVKALAVPSGEQEVWHLTSLLSEGRSADAIAYAADLMQRGEDPFTVWNILLWMLRNLVLVTASIASGERQMAKIASQHHLPFPSVRGIYPLASRLPLSRLNQFVDWAAQADIDMKTGGFRATKDAPQELLSLIDSFILRCAAVAA